MEYIFAKFFEKFPFVHNAINKRYRKRLKNTNVTLITSNCAGGIIYHWLGLKFNSPFINLWLTNDDYIRALENFDDFINTPILECKTENVDYPVGVGWGGIKIYFMHYDTFLKMLTVNGKNVLNVFIEKICVYGLQIGVGMKAF